MRESLRRAQNEYSETRGQMRWQSAKQWPTRINPVLKWQVFKFDWDCAAKYIFHVADI